MRCQKVRYYLSAYYRGELSGGKRKAIAAHLKSCPACQQQEAAVREIAEASESLPEFRVSSDFNARLLNRIAAERFQETRNKAYFPKRVPIINWGRTIPVVATACFAVAFVLAGGLRNLGIQKDSAPAYEVASNNTAGTTGLNESYMTVQPDVDHRAFTQHAASGWAFQKQLAKANRIRGLMSSLASQKNFESCCAPITNNPYLMVGPGFYIEIPMRGATIMPLPTNPNPQGVMEVNQTY